MRRRVDFARFCWLLVSVKQRLPSDPVVMLLAPLLAVGIGNAAKTCVVGLNCPISLAVDSVNQRLPSGPVVMLLAPLLAIGNGKHRENVGRRAELCDVVGLGLDEPEIAVRARI